MAKSAVGHYVCYVPRRFRPGTLGLIAQVNRIIEEYERLGISITLRQLYYQFVARNLLPNLPASYDRLGTIVNNARLAGLVSWTAIEDRGRSLMGLKTCTSPGGALRLLRKDYRIDKWADQPFRPEVWVEKHALEGVVGSICDELQVDFFGIGGYNSQSEQWRAGRRFASYIAKGQRPIVFHLGDHDPSGLDMTRDNRERLEMFVGVPIQVVRLALNMPQVESYNLPPNPAKVRDPRFEGYAVQFGEESWELDALEPSVIRGLIRDAVLRVRSDRLWDDALRQEAEDKIVLDGILEDFKEEGADGLDDKAE